MVPGSGPMRVQSPCPRHPHSLFKALSAFHSLQHTLSWRGNVRGLGRVLSEKEAPKRRESGKGGYAFGCKRRSARSLFQKSGPLVGNLRALGAILRSKKPAASVFEAKNIAPFAPYFHNWGPILLHCIFLRPKNAKKVAPISRKPRVWGPEISLESAFQNIILQRTCRTAHRLLRSRCRLSR